MLNFVALSTTNFTGFSQTDFANLQLAIWEMLYNAALNTVTNAWDTAGTDFNFSSGSSLDPSGFFALATTFNPTNYNTGNWFLMSNDGGLQVLIGQVNAPEPGTYLLLGSLLLISMLTTKFKKIYININ